MKAVLLTELGAAEDVRLTEVPRPMPGANEVIVRLRAAALNHRDIFIRQGLYPGIKLPVILGSDGAGEVTELGPGVDSSWIGASVVVDPCLDWGPNPKVHSHKFRILGMPENGTHAEFVKVPVGNLAKKPSGLSFEEAAALPLAGMTAYRAVVTRAGVESGEKVLVTGIGGGVAALALQIARSRGAHVFVTSGSDEKIARAIELGAEGGVNYRSSDWGKEIVALTGGGPDVVIDSIGGDTFNKALEILKLGGRLATYGATTGAASKVEVRRIFWKQLSLFGSTMGTKADFLAMLELYDSGGLHPIIDQVFALEEASKAYQRMEESSQFGKIVLRIGG